VATLGCGEYEAFVTTRGGLRIIGGALPWTALSWGRALDDTSEATLDGVSGADCCDVLAVARPWRHELAVYRDGVRVWSGPLIRVNAPVEAAKLTARDLTAWWDRRFVHDDHSFAATDLATVFRQISEDAMEPDNTPGLYVETTPSGVLADLDVLGAQHKRAGPLLRDLANIGIDWTVVDRRILAGGLVVPTTSIGPFLIEHFVQTPTVTIDGAAQANVWHVVSGGGSQGDSVHGHAQDQNAINADGYLEDVATVSTIQEAALAEEAAASRLALTTEPLLVERVVLSPDAPFAIDDLVPGTVCQLCLETCIPVDDYFRLKSVAVTAGGKEEAVALTFEPLGGPSV